MAQKYIIKWRAQTTYFRFLLFIKVIGQMWNLVSRPGILIGYSHDLLVLISPRKRFFKKLVLLWKAGLKRHFIRMENTSMNLFMQSEKVVEVLN